jgi:hypothetical protein
MVSEERRQIGGQSNRKGNRYEDAFAVFRSIQLAPDVMHRGQSVRLRDQAGCPVDDLVIHQESQTHYYQLKDHQTIAWGPKGSKLREDYESGIVEQPCDSESFCRFVDRVLEASPTTFEEFVRLLP